jgi:DNA-binding PadR family transcriptional regulator
MEYKRELLKGNTESLLLSLLERRAMYGYELIKEMGHRSAGYFQFREGTIYPALHRLEREGLIQGKWERSSSGQERRYYHLTEKGYCVLAEKMEEWQRFSTAVNMVIETVNR